ncbi:MAG: chromosome partitioning ATPase [Lysobacterales bacterium]|nr:MAG: chromosome partitioning ATPase [Xanthomonadales bacterium]
MSIVETAISKTKQDARFARGDKPAETPLSSKRSADLAAAVASLPLLELSIERLRHAGIAPPAADERRLMAEYRAIKRSVLAPLSQRTATPLVRGNVIMVASALPGEGKTFTSFNLAMSMATERDWTTVLVDADCTRQYLTASVGLSGQPGLLDVLSDPGRSLSEVTYRTSIPGLLYVPAGSSSANATELMASDRMAGVVHDLLRLNPRTILIFDSSPILPTPESRALADATGQIVLVVKADETARSDVKAALDMLGPGHTVGVVLNQFQGSAPLAEYYGADVAKVDSKPST